MRNHPGLMAGGASLLLTMIGAAADPQPSVQQILPQGWTIGQSTEVKIWGSHLDQLASVRVESPDLEAAVVASSATAATIRVSSKTHARLGPHRLHLVTRRGLSNPFLFRLTAWESTFEAEPNNEMDRAQPAGDRTIINGTIADTDDADFYRFQARRGETVAFQTLLGRNGYATGGEIGNVTLTLLHSSGRVVNRSFGRFLWDPYFQHTFDENGAYFLVVEHARLAVTCFVNNCEHRRLGESYQLAIGRTPVLWSLWPPVVEAGKSYQAVLTADLPQPGTRLAFSGTGVSGVLDDSPQSPGRWSVSLMVAPDAAEGPRMVSVADPSGIPHPLPLTVVKSGLRVESEPNDSPETATAQTKPLLLLGRIDHPGDVDSFPIQANEGEPLVLEVQARRFGSEMLDPHVALLAADGDLTAVNDDAPSLSNTRNRDPRLDLKIPNAPNCAKRSDRFVVQVRDNSRHAGDSRFYLLSVREQKPGFDIALQTGGILLQRGGAADVSLRLRRQDGFDGEVVVAAEKLPDGLTAEPVVIRSTATSATLRIAASATAALGPIPLVIAGSAKIGESQVVRRAIVPNPFLGDGFAFVDWPEPQAWLSVVPAVPFSLEQIQGDRNIAGGRSILSLGRGAEVELLVKIERRPQFTAPLSVELEGLPAGLTLNKTEWTDEGRIARLIVKASGSPKIGLGEYPVAIVGTGDFGDNRWSESTGTFLLRVEP